jgi:hypothetical protein
MEATRIVRSRSSCSGRGRQSNNWATRGVASDRVYRQSQPLAETSHTVGKDCCHDGCKKQEPKL